MATEFESMYKNEIEEPKMYKVILLNDDYTTMEFVIEVLMKVFKKSLSEASTIMLNIHNNGKEVCGVYTYEIAITKSTQVRDMARSSNFPLKAIIQED